MSGVSALPHGRLSPTEPCHTQYALLHWPSSLFSPSWLLFFHGWEIIMPIMGRNKQCTHPLKMWNTGMHAVLPLLSKYSVVVFTPHAQRERGKVIGVGPCIIYYIPYTLTIHFLLHIAWDISPYFIPYISRYTVHAYWISSLNYRHWNGWNTGWKSKGYGHSIPSVF